MLVSTVFAADYTVTVKGKLVTPTGETEIPYGINAYVNGVHQYPASGTNLNEDRSFEFKDISFKTGDEFTITLNSSCSYHYFKIDNQNDQFVVTDIENSSKEFKKTSSTTIDLGNLVEDKSGRIQLNSDVVASVYLPEAGGTATGYTGYLSNALIPGKAYEAEINNDQGQLLFKKTITSSPDYCKTTLLTKSGSDVIVSYCDNDQCGNSDSQYLDVFVKKGWNLLNMQRLDFSESNTCATSILGMALYTKTLPGYVVINTPRGIGYNSGTDYRYTPANGAEIIGKEFALESYSAKSPGVWLYATSDCTVKAKKIKPQEPSISDLAKYKLTAGWNLIGADRWMIGKTWATILSDCELQNINAWIRQDQKWAYSSAAEAINYVKTSAYQIKEIEVQEALAIKVAKDCYLVDVVIPTITPPTLD